MVGNNSWTHPAFFSRHLAPQNVGNIIFVCYFLNIGSESKNQCSWHFSKKSIPGLFYLEPHRNVNATTLNFAPQTLKTFKNTYQSVFKLDFFVTSGFPKTRDLSPAAPRDVYISRIDPPRIFSDNVGQPSNIVTF